MEDGEAVSSSKKVLPFTVPFMDVMDSLERPAPATLVVPEYISQMVKEGGGYENPELSVAVIERLRRIYSKLATRESETTAEGKVMNLQDVESWLVKINRELGRGDEYREAARQMGWTEPEEFKDLSYNEVKKLIRLPVDGFLTLHGFINVYQRELKGGKFWGIGHDLAILGEPLPNVGVFKARFDRIYCSASVVPHAVLDTESTTPCPNDVEPSDHLPVAATLVRK